jgi:hypothetical protein
MTVLNGPYGAGHHSGKPARKGQRAIRIFAPMPIKPKQPAETQKAEQGRLLFRVVPGLQLARR